MDLLPPLAKLYRKIKALDNLCGFLLCYDPDYSKMSPKLKDFVLALNAEQLDGRQNNDRELRRLLLILELQSFKGIPQMDSRSEIDVFRSKYLLTM